MLRTSAFLSSVNTTLTGRDVSATKTVQSCWCKGIFLAGENKFDLTVGVSRVYVVHVRTGRKKASVVGRRGFFHLSYLAIYTICYTERVSNVM